MLRPAMDVLFVCDPPESFAPQADSTLAMMREAIRRGHRALCTLVAQLALRGSDAWAEVTAVDVADPERGGRAERTGPATWRPLKDFDVVLMRKDPPFDSTYLASTWILDRANTAVFNAPAGLRDFNEKLATALFPGLTPQTFVTRDAAELRRVLDLLGGRMILKPVFGFGGREILLARHDDPNLGSLFEFATAEGTRWTVAQEYLPAAKRGDKRILMVDGEPVGAVVRVPAPGELRNNFHAGGSPEACELDEDDRAICSVVGPVLRDRGQFFVGLDVIGGRLTEINVTSPTGMQEIDRLAGLRTDSTMAALFWRALETKLSLGRVT